MNTKTLRQKILDLAIHGKLVAQDPDDEPASELLKRINPQAEQTYEEELPKGWVITPMNILCSLVDGEKQSGIERINLDVKYLRGDRRAKKTLSSGKYVAANSLLILVDGENSGEVFRTPIEGYQGSTLKQLFVNANMNIEYVLQVINLHRKELRENKVGSAIPHLNKKLFKEIEVPLPPLAEQKRIVAEIERWFALIDQIEQSKAALQATIAQAKKKILDLAIHGKLVAQDPDDEPASELLKRINPQAEQMYEEELPKGWTYSKLEDVVDYEQPTNYIVHSTNYSDAYSIPVLTAGKSFIIGYTNEHENVYTKLPCIIFDDFTTNSKFVDFQFKVKSSAMKILQVRAAAEVKYVAMFMSITRLIGDTHKRYWISEYSKIKIPLPPLAEQKRIVKKIEELFGVLDTIQQALGE
ncbi:MAG: restriction endonuclease subunit S [Bacteroidales bacterium]|nr:restriction endonuclease subunit S [Bacteroidales bacterium]